MNIREKFEQGAAKHTYQRINAEFKVNIFLGYNQNGQMSMVITENGKDAIVKSSKLINVSLRKRKDNKMALTFDLLDDNYKSLFVIFCKDIISVCEKAGSHMAISNALNRWKYWKKMFGSRNYNLLDKMEIKGLIGELYILKDYFIKQWGESIAIKSWMGPLLGHKDFEINNTWYEVKSVNENALLINISSLEQLESDIDGHLFVVKLEETNTTFDSSINLNKAVLSILDEIKDPDSLELFQTKLDNIGYEYNQEYDNYCFIYKGRSCYFVTDEFPRIRRKDLHQSIGNCKYTILLNGIEAFKEY